MIIGIMIGGLLGGYLWGLIPYFIARNRNLPIMGDWALFWCGLSGMVSAGSLSFLVMLGFIIAARVCQVDFVRPLRRRRVANNWTVDNRAIPYGRTPVVVQSGLVLSCLSGPLRGQTYNINQKELMIGRDVDCHVRLPGNQEGISRHHCAIRWQQGIPVLVDLNSSCGTFLGNGTKLPPNYPTAIAPGTRFYLSSPGILFQITV